MKVQVLSRPNDVYLRQTKKDLHKGNIIYILICSFSLYGSLQLILTDLLDLNIILLYYRRFVALITCNLFLFQIKALLFFARFLLIMLR